MSPEMKQMAIIFLRFAGILRPRIERPYCGGHLVHIIGPNLIYYAINATKIMTLHVLYNNFYNLPYGSGVNKSQYVRLQFVIIPT